MTVRSLFDGTRPGRVLTYDESMTLGARLLAMVKQRSESVSIEHVSNAIVKVANNRVIATNTGDEITIGFWSRIGSNIQCRIFTDQLDDQSLRRVVEQAEKSATPLPDPTFMEPDDPNDPRYYTYNKREYIPVNLWRDSTAEAMQGSRNDIVADMIGRAKSANLQGAATIGLTAKSQLFMYKQGLTTYSRETDCEVTMTARQPDGRSSGWAGQANRDWSKISPITIADRSIEISNLSKNMVGMEPGRRTAILSPAAVAQLLRQMPRLFNANATDRGGTPFSYRDQNGRTNRLFMKVFDERLNFVSDPQDPEGGFPPFYENGGMAGLPIPKVAWVDNGILQNLNYDVGYGLSRGKPWNDAPESVRVQASNDSETKTVEEMIAMCDDGIFVNRFSQVSLLDISTGMMTGVTRDGCFHIKDGKINKPIKNFRFTDSPMFAFNSIIAIGKSERVAFGYTSNGGRWPRLPIICPPMMVRDFNFSAISDAV